MRSLIIASAFGIVAIATSASASSQSAPPSATQSAVTSGELGYHRGALGYDALVAGDVRTAEIQLETAANVATDDPARLINLGYVHMRTGRLASAQRLFETVRDGRTSFAVELADGSVADSRDVARRALSRMATALASR